MKKVRNVFIALAMAFAGLVGVINPASASHDNDFGHWNQPPLVVTPQFGLDASIQDAAYYWQDWAFYRGYYPPLPASILGCAHQTGRIVICTVPQYGPELQGSKGIINPRLYPDGSGHIQSIMMWVAQELTGMDRQITFRHEFGHALGLGHRDKGIGHGWVCSLMNIAGCSLFADNIDHQMVKNWQPPNHSH